MSKPRVDSTIGVHHIIMRGINHESIAYDEEDFSRLLNTLVRFSGKYGVKIISYAIMSNHIHLEVFCEQLTDVSDMVRSVCTSYVRHYFNSKYSREGSLFQSRFKNRAVEYGTDIVTLSRYIVLNPNKAGMDYKTYPYSAYQSIIEDYKCGKDKGWLKTSFIRNEIRMEEYTDLTASKAADMRCEAYRISDEEIEQYIFDESGLSAKELKSGDTDRVRTVLNTLRRNNISFRRITRITGIRHDKIIALSGK